MLIKERPRSEFAINSTLFKKNPINGKMEPTFSKKTRIIRMLAAFATILFMVSYFIHKMFIL
jgi:hypothetical protein